MEEREIQAGSAGGTQAGGAAAGEAGLDLSLGHLGTTKRERRWMAVCDACHHSLGEESYLAAEAAAGPRDDPRCPSCNRCLWSFHPLD